MASFVSLSLILKVNQIFIFSHVNNKKGAEALKQPFI